DHGVGFLELHDIGSAQRAAFDIGDGAVVAPDVVQIAGILVGHRIEHDLLHRGVYHREHTQPNSECADRGCGKDRSAHEAASDELDIAAPVAATTPRGCWAGPFGGTVAQ